MNSLFVRVDGSAEIGLGHFVRCVALAQVVQDLFEITFVSKIIPESCLSEIESNGFKFFSIFCENDFSKRLRSADTVIIDGYHFDTEYEKSIKSKGCTLFTIDDLFNRHYVSDGIINHGLGIDPKAYSKDSGTKLYLGTDYLMVRSNFYEASLAKREIASVENLYINLGGSDPGNITLRILEHLDCKKYKNIHIVLGAANTSFVIISELIKVRKLTNIHLYYNLNQFEMENVMRKCELAICTPSGIAYELCCIGIGLIVCKTASNQEHFYKAFKSKGLGLGVDTSKPHYMELLLSQCYALTVNTSAIKKQIGIQRKYFSNNSKFNLKEVLAK